MNWNEIPERRSEPDFNNIIKVLRREEPSHPTLFEFILNDRLYRELTPDLNDLPETVINQYRRRIQVSHQLGYDFLTIQFPGFSFKEGVIERHQEKTISLNEGSVIGNWDEFEQFSWPDPNAADYGLIDELAEFLPAGMKFIPYTPDGMLENIINLVGYERLCMLIKDDPLLVHAIAEQVTTRLLNYYEHVIHHPLVGACISNDDWGFNTQTIFSPRDMRQFVFPYHKRIAETIHAAGKLVILHSCGHFQRIIDDIIDDMHYDARHSYQDAIMPVEEAYECYHERIAILGGIDMDFLCRASPKEIYQRSMLMLERTAGRGGYALGSGNSVPEYVPNEGYFAMLRAALDFNKNNG